MNKNFYINKHRILSYILLIAIVLMTSLGVPMKSSALLENGGNSYVSGDWAINVDNLHLILGNEPIIAFRGWGANKSYPNAPFAVRVAIFDGTATTGTPISTSTVITAGSSGDDNAIRNDLVNGTTGWSGIALRNRNFRVSDYFFNLKIADALASRDAVTLVVQMGYMDGNTFIPSDFVRQTGDSAALGYSSATSADFRNYWTFRKVAGSVIYDSNASGNTVTNMPTAPDSQGSRGFQYTVENKWASIYKSIPQRDLNTNFNTELARCVSLVNKYKDNPVIAGFSIIDEPNADLFDRMAVIREEIGKLLPDGKYVTANLNPWYSNVSSGFGASNYEIYVDSYMSKVKPDILSFDNYPIRFDLSQAAADQDYVRNLLVIRGAALKYEVPFVGYIQAIQYSGRREPTYNELRWQVNMHLAFGANGFSYFTYSQVDQLGVGGFERRAMSMIDWNGNTTYLHDYAKNLAKELTGFSNIILPYKQEGFILKNLDSNITQLFSSELQKASYGNLSSIETTGQMLNGCYDLDGQKGIYLFNWNRDESMNATLKFDKMVKVQLWSKVGLEETITANELDLSILAGEAKFLIFSNPDLILVLPPEWVVPEGLSEWAVSTVKAAVERGLATDDLMKDFQANTTRAEFCRAAVNFVEKYYDMPVSDILEERGLEAKTFADTNAPAIAAAAALGITNGTDIEKNLFSPDLPLTREQAATMLKRILDVLEIIVDSETVEWTDADSISGYAVEAIDIIYAAGVMGGMSTESLVFSPKTAYIHEQSIVTFNRLWDFLFEN